MYALDYRLCSGTNPVFAALGEVLKMSIMSIIKAINVPKMDSLAKLIVISNSNNENIIDRTDQSV
jgi:hypothetical protein